MATTGRQGVRRVELLVEVEAGDGMVTTYKVVGQPGRIWGRGMNADIKPHYGNPGEGPTQVEIHLDCMLIPVGNEQLHSITEEPLVGELESRQNGSAGGETIVIQAIESGRQA